MATFKAGQRVRIVSASSRCQYLVGLEAVIVSGVSQSQIHGANLSPEFIWYELIPIMAHELPFPGPIYAPAHDIVPLTDPGFDAFMQKVMKPINEPITVNV